MVDGRTFTSADGWTTIYLVTPAGKRPVLDKQEADQVRFIVVHSR